MVMKISKMLFKKININPDCAMNATSAFNFVKETHYDLIILDIGLPDMDGIELAHKIRKYERRYRIQESKIYAVTAYDLKNVHRACLSSGMNDAFNKPLMIDGLNRMINSVSSSEIT